MVVAATAAAAVVVCGVLWRGGRHPSPVRGLGKEENIGGRALFFIPVIETTPPYVG